MNLVEIGRFEFGMDKRDVHRLRNAAAKQLRYRWRLRVLKAAAIVMAFLSISCARTVTRGVSTPPIARATVVVRNKTAVWNPPSPMMHIAYATVFIGSGGHWARLGSTKATSFTLPTGNYVRDIGVTFTPEPYWPFPETPKSVVPNVHL